ncbi:unnamed protein product [Phytophthora fragariaefolia]|uniref:Unnamed protein product n=1 Tax=Phytophthora fragariaefolia TaxID=1490495 RepID=A0A9W6TL51_9STRA|nr:unnamed protein product [Phytophthora fragariaefolia]
MLKKVNILVDSYKVYNDPRLRFDQDNTTVNFTSGCRPVACPVVQSYSSRAAIARLGAGTPDPNGEHNVAEATGKSGQHTQQERHRQSNREAHHAQPGEHLGQRDARAERDHEAVGHQVREAAAEAHFPFSSSDAEVGGPLGFFDLDGVGLVRVGHGVVK